MISVLNIISPVFIVLGIGYWLKKTKVLGKDANAALSFLVFYISGPCLLFLSAAHSNISEAFDLGVWIVAVVISVATAVASYFIFAKRSHKKRGVLAQGSFRANMMFIGLPITVNAFGEKVLGPAAIFIGLMVPLYNLLAVLCLSFPRQDHTGKDSILIASIRDILTNPFILGSVTGIVFSVSGLDLPLAIERTLGTLAKLALPLALLSLGAEFNIEDFRSDFKLAVCVSFIKLIIYPALIYLGLRFAGKTGMFLMFPVLIVATPVAVVSAVMAHEMKRDDKLAGSILIATTIGSSLTIPLWLFFFKL